MKTLAELVKMNYTFSEYIQGKFIYEADDKSFKLLIPLDEIGQGNLLCHEKGITLMKWIKQYIKFMEGRDYGHFRT